MTWGDIYRTEHTGDTGGCHCGHNIAHHGHYPEDTCTVCDCAQYIDKAWNVAEERAARVAENA